MKYTIGQNFGKLTREEIKEIAEYCNNNGKCHLFCIDNEHYEIRENEPIIISEKEQLQNEKIELEQWLRNHYYIGVMITTGKATAEEYNDEINLMAEKVNRINEIDSLLATM